MRLGVFVVVIEAQNLEVSIHKENCMVEKLSEIQFTNTSDDTDSISIIICGSPTENTQQPSRQKFQL